MRRRQHGGLGDVALLVLLLLLGVRASSNLSLLSGTLRTFQVYACDDEELAITCVSNTVINIYFAHYGRQTEHNHLCPGGSNDTAVGSCSSKDALQYSLLQTVEATCRDQRICKFRTGPSAFGADPCPGFRKYAEVAYKCRPKTFMNRVVCEGDRLRLKCQDNLRLVIFSAMFGSTHYGVAECSRGDNSHGDDCQVSYATETVMSSCHGKRQCTVAADAGTFGNPGCPKGNKIFLKVAYTCVPRELLKHLDLRREEDEEDFTGFIEEPRYVPQDTTPPSHPEETLKQGSKMTAKPSSPGKNKTEKSAGVFTEWVSAYSYLQENKERVILYVTLAVVLSLLLFGGAFFAHRSLKARRGRPVGKGLPSRRPRLSLSDPLPPDEDDICTMSHLDGSLRRPSLDFPRTPISSEVSSLYYS